jgi:hypothetical protein
MRGTGLEPQSCRTLHSQGKQQAQEAIKMDNTTMAYESLLNILLEHSTTEVLQTIKHIVMTSGDMEPEDEEAFNQFCNDEVFNSLGYFRKED